MSDRCNAPVGVFDSGVGGLTVAREIMRNLPEENIVYFGDTARVPYGTKSKDTVLRYSRQIIRFLKTQDVKAIVIACNTASAYALEDVEKELDIPIIGVVKPGAKVACEATHNKKIGVIATEATINSGIYSSYITRQDPQIQVIGKACPLFVPLVEEGWLKDSVTFEVAGRYLRELMEQDIDTLILGCTHYPLLRSTLREIVGEKVTLVNPAYETARELKQLLAEKGLTNIQSQEEARKYQFYVSDQADKFMRFADSILPFDVEKTQKIDIEKYINEANISESEKEELQAFSNGNIENINYTQLPKLFMKDTSLFTSYGMAIALDMQENLNNYCKVSQNTDGSITATLDISTDESKVIADHIFNAGTMIQTLDIHSNMKKDKTSYTNISTLNGSINLGFFQVNINSNIKTSLQNTNDISINIPEANNVTDDAINSTNETKNSADSLNISIKF